MASRKTKYSHGNQAGDMNKAYSVIFGLTADPIHLGYEQAIINGVEFLKQQASISTLLLIPVYQPNLIVDKKAPVAKFKYRVDMCEQVAKRLTKQLNCEIKVSQIEQQIVEATGQANYSLNTIKQLKLKNCLFMVSTDHFQGRWPRFRKWYKWQEILQYSGLLINQRSGHGINQSFIEQLKEYNSEIYVVENELTVDTSSTAIRNNLNKSRRYLSTDIYKYVLKNKIYSNMYD